MPRGFRPGRGALGRTKTSDAAVPAHGWHKANLHIHEQSGALPPPALRRPPFGGVFVPYGRHVEVMP